MRNLKFLKPLLVLAAFLAAITLGYSLLLGRGHAIPEKIDYSKVRQIALTYGKETRVLTPLDINEMDDVLKALGKAELKSGLAPLTPDPEVATMTIWYTRGKYENLYIFMEHSVMQSQGLMIPYHYKLVDDHGLRELIKQIVSVKTRTN